MNQEISDFHASIDNLNSFMTDMKCPQDLQLELRAYFKKCKSAHKEKYNREVLEMMSPGLQKRFIFKVFSKSVEGISFIDATLLPEDIRFEFLSQLVLQLQAVYYPANERVIEMNEVADNMYIIKKGLVGCQGKVLHTNQSFGEDLICGMRRDYWATTLTFSILLRLNKDDLIGVVQQGGFELISDHMYSRVKWIRMRKSFRRFRETLLALTKLAEEKKRLEEDEKEKTFAIRYFWSDDTKTRIGINVDGKRHPCELKIGHIRLLHKEPHLIDLMRPLNKLTKESAAFSFLEDDGGESIEGPPSSFRRTVPVVEMTEVDLTNFMLRLVQGEIGSWLDDYVVSTVLQKVRRRIREERTTTTAGTKESL